MTNRWWPRRDSQHIQYVSKIPYVLRCVDGFFFLWHSSLSPYSLGNFAAFPCTLLQGFAHLNALTSTLLFSPVLSIYFHRAPLRLNNVLMDMCVQPIACDDGDYIIRCHVSCIFHFISSKGEFSCERLSDGCVTQGKTQAYSLFCFKITPISVPVYSYRCII